MTYGCCPRFRRYHGPWPRRVACGSSAEASRGARPPGSSRRAASRSCCTRCGRCGEPGPQDRRLRRAGLLELASKSLELANAPRPAEGRDAARSGRSSWRCAEAARRPGGRRARGRPRAVRRRASPRRSKRTRASRSSARRSPRSRTTARRSSPPGRSPRRRSPRDRRAHRRSDTSTSTTPSRRSSTPSRSTWRSPSAPSRYGKGEASDYLNCPMTREEYDAFYDGAARRRGRPPLHDFDREPLLRGLPADRGAGAARPATRCASGR